MAEERRNDGAREDSVPWMPAGEPFAPRGRGLRVPPGAAVAGIAVATAVVAVVLLARSGRSPRALARRGRERLAALAFPAPTARHVRREARARGFWAGVVASAGSALASTLARRLAEDLVATAARHRVAAEAPARG